MGDLLLDMIVEGAEEEGAQGDTLVDAQEVYLVEVDLPGEPEPIADME